MILTSGDSISIFFRLLPYTTYIIPIASFIIAVVIGLSIRGKACRIERDYTRTSADITSVRRVSKRTHIKYEYRDQSGVLHNGFLSVRGITNYNSMSSIAIYYNPNNPSVSYTERTMNSDKMHHSSMVVRFCLELWYFYGEGADFSASFFITS